MDPRGDFGADDFAGESESDPLIDGEGDGDAVEHLWNAAHEMLSAMRTLLDAADEFVASQRGSGDGSAARRPRARPAGERAGRVRPINIDVRDDGDSRSPSRAPADRPGESTGASYP
jgi:hypothetical protein